jgi:hypothetical protein
MDQPEMHALWDWMPGSLAVNMGYDGFTFEWFDEGGSSFRSLDAQEIATLASLVQVAAEAELQRITQTTS